MKRVSRSDVMYRGRPKYLYTWAMKSAAQSAAVASILHGISTVYLVKRSTAMRIALSPLRARGCSGPTQSIVIHSHGLEGGGSGMIGAAMVLMRAFAFWHVGHVAQYCSTSRPHPCHIQ